MALDVGPAGLILALGGRSKTGKSHLARVTSESLGWRRAAFGDYVREIAASRYLDPSSPDTLLELGAELVNTDCTSFCRAVLERADWAPGRGAILDGIRHVMVLNTIRALVAPADVRLIMVDAAPEIRERRLRDIGIDGECAARIESHSTTADIMRLTDMADLVVDGGTESKEAVALITGFVKQSITHGLTR